LFLNKKNGSDATFDSKISQGALVISRCFEIFSERLQSKKSCWINWNACEGYSQSKCARRKTTKRVYLKRTLFQAFLLQLAISFASTAYNKSLSDQKRLPENESKSGSKTV